MLLLYTLTALLAVVSVQSQQPGSRRGGGGGGGARNFIRDRNRGRSENRNLASVPGYGKGFYRDRFNGQSFCSTLQNPCCDSRDDDCSVAIEETRCYCDKFCDQGQEDPWNRRAPDCCPDYKKVCKGDNTPPEPSTTCRSDEFKCDVDNKCIDGRYRCDGTQHCRDGSDEIACGASECGDDQFTCESDQKCINRRHRCDGFDHCSDGSDELECGQFGITLKPDIIHLEDHPSHKTHVDFTCEFQSRHNLRLQMTTDPPQRAIQNLPADRYSYFTTGKDEQSLPIRPNIRAIVCEAFDQYGDKVLFAKSKILEGAGDPGALRIAERRPSRVDDRRPSRVDEARRYPTRDESRRNRVDESRRQPIEDSRQPAACTMNDVTRRCGRYNQKMEGLVRSGLSDFNQLCCLIHEQVSCLESLNCPIITNAIKGTSEAQIQQLCGGYVYTPGCADVNTEQ